MSLRKHRLIEVEWPEFGGSDIPPRTTVEEFEKRIDTVRKSMEKSNLTHLVIYGDSEHFANLMYLTGFDPRFEESVLIISSDGTPLIVVGTECKGYLPISPLYREGRLRSECYQPFSLVTLPRDNSRFIKEIFAGEGIDKGSRVGCVGWKYYSDSEHPDGVHTLEIPSFIVDTLRDLVGFENVVNASGIFINPNNGLRTFCSPSEIAYFEYSNVLASEGMKRMIFGIHEGMTDYELASLSHYNGSPLGCRMTLKTGNNRLSLSGPMGETVSKGGIFSTNICYWGSNICRSGWVVSSAEELPENVRDYVENFAGLYYEVMSEWFSMLKIGACGDEIYRFMAEKLPFDKFGVVLNPGHLTHLDEWVSTPFYLGSEVRLHSGMVIQSDVIPHSKTYYSTRMEEGIVIADEKLRYELRSKYPECYYRCMKRRDFMMNVLGFELSEEILPLSNIPAIVPPFLLSPNILLAMEK